MAILPEKYCMSNRTSPTNGMSGAKSGAKSGSLVGA